MGTNTFGRSIISAAGGGAVWLAVMVLFTTSSPALAQSVSSFEELRAGGLLAPGEPITVEDTAGLARQGIVVEIDGNVLKLRLGSAEAEPARLYLEQDVKRISRNRRRVLPMAALIGAGSAFAVTAAAASSYGRNEGGRFCGACLVQWSTFTVPTGAAAGALVGLVIDLARRRPVFEAGAHRPAVTVVPVLTDRGVGGVARVTFR